MAGASPDLRPGIVEALRLLSSPELQLEYERRVPGISVPSELLCRWFDDAYLPDSPAFRRCFSSNELEALAHFGNYFAAHEKFLPDLNRGVASWLKDDTWKAIMSEARRALVIFGV
jgi:hypothetical protein